MDGIEPFFYAYMAGWSAACLAALGLVVRRPADFDFAGTVYWRYLLPRWKIATFLVAATGITVMAPYTGDPIWDYYDALKMSVLTFATAPWAVGTLFRAVRWKRGWRQAFVALCGLLFFQLAKLRKKKSCEGFTVHDLRRTASTIPHEQGFNSDVIEKALNHTMRGVRGVYNRAQYAEQRRTMLQHWADYLDGLCAGAKVTAFKKVAGA